LGKEVEGGAAGGGQVVAEEGEREFGEEKQT